MRARNAHDGPRFANEVELCAAFIAQTTRDGVWTAYAETCGFDILLANRESGVQIGVQAKLVLNAKVLAQIIPHASSYHAVECGPDYRAVLVPSYATQGDLHPLFDALGISVLRQCVLDDDERFRAKYFSLPTKAYVHGTSWHEWLPQRRCALPDYVPDVAAGASAPMALTPWKVAAIKLVILLTRRPVSRSDFKALGLSPSRWTDPYTGWLTPTDSGYVAGKHIPDFRRQHPRNYAEIEADFEKWAPPPLPLLGRLDLASKVST